MAQTVRHELQHTMQSLIESVNEISELGGLPSKNIRDSRVNYDGEVINQNYPEELMDNGDKDIGGRLLHQLRDVEFHNRISDEVSTFNWVKSQIPLKLHEDFMKCWIGHITFHDFNNRLDKVLWQRAEIEEPRQTHMWTKELKRQMDKAISASKRGIHFFEIFKNTQPLKYKKAVSEFIKAVS